MKYSQEASASLIYAMQFVTMETHLHLSVACVLVGAGVFQSACNFFAVPLILAKIFLILFSSSFTVQAGINKLDGRCASTSSVLATKISDGFEF